MHELENTFIEIRKIVTKKHFFKFILQHSFPVREYLFEIQIL